MSPAEPFTRKLDDRAWDTTLVCEHPGCADPECPTRRQRNAYRLALGTLVEALQTVADAQDAALDYWGVCDDPSCTFEARLQKHLSNAGRHLSVAVMEFSAAVEMWKALPNEWDLPEISAAMEAISRLKKLNIEALDQVQDRIEGSPGNHP